MKNIIFYWLPPILWMSLIFMMSTRQSISVSEVTAVNFIFFKSLHIIEYAILFFLLFRAFHTASTVSLQQAFYLSLILSILYGVSDEMHQTFVPTRGGSPRDVIIDTIGILLCFMYTKSNLPKLKRLL